QTIDQRWKEHLLVIDKLKEGINLRGYAQKDPLIEYKKEAFNAYQNLFQAIRTDTVEKMMKVQIVAQEAGHVAEQFRPEETDLKDLNYRGGEEGPMGYNLDSGMNGDGAPSSSPSGRQRMRMGPPTEGADERPMNRAQRRRMEREQRKR